MAICSLSLDLGSSESRKTPAFKLFFDKKKIKPKTLYGGQFAPSTRLLSLNYMLNSPANTAPQFL